MIRNAALVCCGLALAGATQAQLFDGLQVRERVFNDYPDSTLNITNAYPASFSIEESNFGSGGFANRHMAFLSNDGGATAFDFNYGNGFDFCVTMNLDADPVDGREAGIMTDLFGFGFFGALPNGEIAAFGSFLPFHSFGVGVYTNGTDVDLRMIYRPGAGEGQTPASTMEYIIDTGSGPISSGQIEFTNTEGGIPSGMPQDQFLALIGVGVQSAGGPGGSSNVTFTDFKVIPAPGTGVLALAGLGIAARRRRA